MPGYAHHKDGDIDVKMELFQGVVPPAKSLTPIVLGRPTLNLAQWRDHCKADRPLFLNLKVPTLLFPTHNPACFLNPLMYPSPWRWTYQIPTHFIGVWMLWKMA